MTRLQNNIEQLNDALGKATIQQVQLEELIPMLSERVNGAEQPESKDQFYASLVEAREKLGILKGDMHLMRRQLADLYEERIRVLDMEIQNCIDAWDIDEMTAMKSRLREKISELLKIN